MYHYTPTLWTLGRQGRTRSTKSKTFCSRQCRGSIMRANYMFLGHVGQLISAWNMQEHSRLTQGCPKNNEERKNSNTAKLLLTYPRKKKRIGCCQSWDSVKVLFGVRFQVFQRTEEIPFEKFGTNVKIEAKKPSTSYNTLTLNFCRTHWVVIAEFKSYQNFSRSGIRFLANRFDYFWGCLEFKVLKRSQLGWHVCLRPPRYFRADSLTTWNCVFG